MKNILITGGAGYIGSHVTETLVNTGYNVSIVDNLSSGYKKLINKKANFFKISINQTKKINKIIIDNKIDSIMHFAAKLDVNESLKKPKKYYYNNVQGTLSLIKASKNTTVKNFIFSSTAAVYKDKIFKVKETSLTKPKSVYGKTKLSAENLIKKKFLKTNIRYAILRYFNIVGSSNSNKIGQINKYDLLFKNLSMALLKKKPEINIYGNDYNTKDGTCIRDYIHVLDISDIHVQVLKKIDISRKSLLLNCGYGKGKTVLEIVNMFKKVSKKNLSIKFKPRRKADLEQIIADNTNLKKILRWKPKYNSLRGMIKSCISWEKKIKYLNAKY